MAFKKMFIASLAAASACKSGAGRRVTAVAGANAAENFDYLPRRRLLKNLLEQTSNECETLRAQSKEDNVTDTSEVQRGRCTSERKNAAAAADKQDNAVALKRNIAEEFRSIFRKDNLMAFFLEAKKLKKLTNPKVEIKFYDNGVDNGVAIRENRSLLLGNIAVLRNRLCRACFAKTHDIRIPIDSSTTFEVVEQSRCRGNGNGYKLIIKREGNVVIELRFEQQYKRDLFVDICNALKAIASNTSGTRATKLLDEGYNLETMPSNIEEKMKTAIRSWKSANEELKKWVKQYLP